MSLVLYMPQNYLEGCFYVLRNGLVGVNEVSKLTRCYHIVIVGRRVVHHEERKPCVEEDRQSTLEMAQEKIAKATTCTTPSKGLIFSRCIHLGGIV